MLKESLNRVLPRSWVHSLKKLYFPRVLRSVTEKDWPFGYVAKSLIKEGDNVVDIGANIGYVTSLLSRYVGDGGKVYSFEPVPETFALLSHSIEKTNLSNVKAFCCGLSSVEGHATMEIPHFSQGGENFYQSHIVDQPDVDSGLRRVRVELHLLDDMLKDKLANIAFMKIDVEGHELGVLNGATKLLSESQPALIVEVAGIHDEEGSNAFEVFKLLLSKGYSAWVFDDGTVRPTVAGEKALDYFFLMPDHIARLSANGLLRQP